MTDDHDQIEENGLTRRDSLLRLGGFAALALGAGAVEALDGQDAKAAATGPAAVASGLVTCVLTPEMTEGPYYLDGDSAPGHPRGTTRHAPRPRDHGGRRRRASRSRARPSTSGTVTRAGLLRLRAGRVRTATRSCAASSGRQKNGLATFTRLPGLVFGPDGSHPRPGLARRQPPCTPGSSSSRSR